MVKCSEVLQCSDGLVEFFLSLCIWLCILCTFVQLCKFCALIVTLIVVFMYLLTCMLCSVYSLPTGTPATLTEVFPYFFLSCKANARGTVPTLPN